eukprot:3235478-Rhodomonas_salina.1
MCIRDSASAECRRGGSAEHGAASGPAAPIHGDVGARYAWDTAGAARARQSVGRRAEGLGGAGAQRRRRG